MTKLENSKNTSNDAGEQLPLPGFMAKLKSKHQNFEKWIENVGSGRFKVHVRRIVK